MNYKHKSQLGRIRLALGLLSVVVTGILSSSAADRTWNGAGDGTTMNSAANWVGGVAPVAGDALFFGGSTGLSVNNNYGANTTFAGITFNSGAGTFTLTGNAINLTNATAPNPGITNNSTSLQTISLVINLNGAHRSWQLVGDIIHTASVNGGGSTTSPQSIIKSGAGTLTLSGTTDNSFGSVVVNGGTVVLAKASTGSVHCLGGYSTVNTNGVLVISGTGGDQIFERTPIQIEGGVLRVQTNELFHIIHGTNSYAGIVENGLVGTSNLLTLGGNNGTPHGVYKGTIRDGAAGILALSLIRNSTVLQLEGTNTYSGTTTINETVSSGATRLIVNGAHIGGSDYNVSGNATANQGVLGGSGRISATSVNVNANGVISPGGSIQDGDSSVFSATTAILTFSNAVNLTTASSTLDLGLNSTTVGSGYDQVVIAGSGSFSNNAANLKLTLGYTPNTGDKFTIVNVQGTSPANNIGIFASLNGVATDLSQGAIFLEPSTGKRFQISYQAEGSTFDMGAGNGNDIMLQVVADAGATLTWRGDGVNNLWDVGTTADWWNGSSLVVFGTNSPVIFDDTGSNRVPVNITAAVATPTVTFNSTNNYVLSGAGALTGLISISKTNTGTVSVVSPTDGLTGPTVIRGGTLQVGTNGTTGSWSGAVTINSGGAFGFNRSDDVTYTAPSLSGAGGFVHSGSGKLTINTALTSFAGRTTNSGGLLQLGDGVGNAGSIGGDINVSGTNVLRYFYPGSGSTAYTIANTVSGNGTVLWEQPENPSSSCFYSIATSLTSSNFSGTHIVGTAVTVHALNDHLGYSFGSNSVVIVTNLYSQVWLDRSAVPYNQSFIISGSGTPQTAPGGTDVTPPYGAIKLFQNTIGGTITMVGNSRIGGSSTGSTITGQIIGNGYDLEIFGDNLVNTFTLSVSNNLNSWGNTKVLFGSLRALSSGAISTNDMFINLNGQLQVNGNTVSVNSLQNGPDGAGVVYNLNNGVAGTLVVGANGSSSTFDGTFGDGSSRALNLTKVGTGTLTLSAVSTNTGSITVSGGTLTLTGSGSFNNATNIAVATGATLDVSGRSDGTLTLTANQTLKHSGSSVGAITVAGNVNVGSGILLLALNRSNSPATNDSLAVSGILTGGGTLTVTNLGPALHVNDSFKLFNAGVSGFAYSLQTTDVVNNVSYTWNNTVGSDGKITVASVTPMINTNAPRIQVSVTGNTLHLGWPTNAGWTLLTNSVNLAVTNQWFPYPNSANLTNVDITVDPVKTNVFFKMQYPYP